MVWWLRFKVFTFLTLFFSFFFFFFFSGHACTLGYRRLSKHLCATCPPANGFLMFVGIVVIVVMLVVLVKFTIDDAGKTSLSALIQKCILNYFQVAALLNGLPLRWPQALLDLFSFKGAMSTAGDHLLNPDCSVGDVTAIQLFYSKQIAFLLAPMFLIPIVYLFWKTYALWSVGETWHRDNEDNEDSETYGRERTTVTL